MVAIASQMSVGLLILSQMSGEDRSTKLTQTYLKA